MASQLWILRGIPARSACLLEAWLDALSDLPLDDWLRIAADCRRASLDSTPQCVARRAAAVAIEQRHLDVTAWFIRDAVASVTHEASGRLRESRSCSPSDIGLVCRATEWAGLAIALETWLDSSVHDELCAPFQALHLAPTPLRVISTSPRLPSRRPTNDLPLHRVPSPR